LFWILLVFVAHGARGGGSAIGADETLNLL